MDREKQVYHQAAFSSSMFFPLLAKNATAEKMMERARVRNICNENARCGVVYRNNMGKGTCMTATFLLRGCHSTWIEFKSSFPSLEAIILGNVFKPPVVSLSVCSVHQQQQHQ